MVTLYDAQGNPVEVDEANLDQTQRGVQLSRKDIKRLETAAREGREAAEELAQLKRERSFVQAGIPVEDKRAAYFIAGYQGEATPEAIRAEWDERRSEANSHLEPPSAMDDELRRIQDASSSLSAGMEQSPPDKLAERNANWRKSTGPTPLDPEKIEEILRVRELCRRREHVATTRKRSIVAGLPVSQSQQRPLSMTRRLGNSGRTTHSALSCTTTLLQTSSRRISRWSEQRCSSSSRTTSPPSPRPSTSPPTSPRWCSRTA